jgi:NAD(P)-dependent dehydrogenase (short-subunit alcohol dehydrogenase family)
MSHPRIAVVTGSAAGIGHAIALRLADDGCDLVLNDLPSQSAQLDALAKEIEARGHKAVIYTGDISVEKNVQELVDMAVLSFGGIDVVSFRIILKTRSLT